MGAPDLAGLDPEYRGRPKRSRWAAWYWAGLTLFTVVLLALSASRDGISPHWAQALAALAFAHNAVICSMRAVVRLDGAGLHTRRAYHRRNASWDDVLDVRPAPWGDSPVAVVREGREVPLLGMPHEAAARLAHALATSRGPREHA